MKYIQHFNNFKINEAAVTPGLVADAIRFMIDKAKEYKIETKILPNTEKDYISQQIVNHLVNMSQITKSLQPFEQIEDRVGIFREIISISKRERKKFSSGDFKLFYDTIRDVVISEVEAIAKTIDENGAKDKTAERLRQMILKIFKEIEPSLYLVRYLIPDSEKAYKFEISLKEIIKKPDNMAFDKFVFLLDELGDMKKYITSTQEYYELYQNTFNELWDLSNQFYKLSFSVDDENAVHMLGSYGLILKKLLPAGFSEIPKFLQSGSSTRMMIFDLQADLVTNLVSLLAIYQIVEKGHYVKYDIQKN